MPFIGAIALLFLAGAGCLNKKVETTTDSNPWDKANLAGIVNIAPVEIHKTQSASNGETCAIDLVYPSIENSIFTEAANDFSEQVFTFLRHQLESEADLTSPDDVTAAVDEYLTTCVSRLEDSEGTAQDTDDDSPEDYLDQYISSDFDITLNALHVLSVTLNAEGYTGGAHGYSTQTFVNVDLGGNRLITLGDILIDDQLKAFFQNEKARLLTASRDVIYPSSVEEFETFIADQATMPTEEQYNVYGQFKNFYLTPTSIVTFYDSYEIAPYAAGPMTVEIPLIELADYIDPSEPFYPVFEQARDQANNN